VTPCDHFADDPGAKDVRIRLAKVCSFLAQWGTKSVDDDDITHGIFSVRNPE
jgi:hypothetical protein